MTVKTRLLILLSTVLFLTSCKTEREEGYKKAICGEWIFVRVGSDNDSINEARKKGKNLLEPPPSLCENKNFRKGYIFYSNNSCEDKRGYFKRINTKSRENGRTLFLGTDTKYKVEDDSLKIFDLSDSIWRGVKIRSITSDTLTLEIKDTIFFKYAKTNYKIDKDQTFDMIIVSTSACFGSCPISSTCIDKFGNFIFYGQAYTTKNGLYISKISQDLYHRIEMNFKKANIDKLDENYSANWTDDQTVSVMFIKDNKIYKTISDYGRQAPRELYWAYTQLSYLYQRLDLKPFIFNTPEPVSIYPASFETNGKICDLTRPERFNFITELNKGKVLNHEFEKKYILKYWDAKDSLRSIFTDGRYYQLGNNGNSITIDLGFNFLQRNNIFERFRKKNKYD